jgi:predicted nucleic acid-binding protein
MECRVKPLATGNAVLLAEFDTAFAATELAPMTTAVFDRATAIRASYKFKTPDSLHLAAAVEAACTVFLTNDHRLAAFTDISVEVV